VGKSRSRLKKLIDNATTVITSVIRPSRSQQRQVHQGLVPVFDDGPGIALDTSAIELRRRSNAPKNLFSGHAGRGIEHGSHESKEDRAGTEAGLGLKNVKSAIVGTFNKLTVAQDYELRRACAPPAASNPGEEHAGRARRRGTQIADAIKDLKASPPSRTPRATRSRSPRRCESTPRPIRSSTFKAGVVEAA